MKSYISIMVVLFLSSCCKAIFESQTIYDNTTNKIIEVRLYNKGTFTSNFIKAKSTSFLDAPFSEVPADSILLFVEGKYWETHYSSTIKKPSTSATIILFADKKNLLNKENYKKTIEKLACDGSRTKYIYKFQE